MDIREAISLRHSVRKYRDQPIEGNTLELLEAYIADVSRESGLHLQLVRNEPRAFKSGIIKYGGFSNVNNYIAMIGPKGEALRETCGYYGEKIVLYAQTIGLNTCWVGFRVGYVPDVYELARDEELALVIAIGYGENSGRQHRSKRPEKVSNLSETSPEWFRKGVEAALLAPTAINQQHFYFTHEGGNEVSVKKTYGPFSDVDLGIVRLHFELGAGKENFVWKEK